MNFRYRPAYQIYEHLAKVYEPYDPGMADCFREMAWAVENNSEETFINAVKGIEKRLYIKSLYVKALWIVTGKHGS